MEETVKHHQDVLLRIQGLKTHLGNRDQPVKAVDGIDLMVSQGETFALLGESGCGKSMTALSIMRLLPPSGRIVAGSVFIDKTELLGLPEVQMRAERGGRVAMIFQEPMTSLNPVMTVGAQIAESVRLHDPESRDRVKLRVVELLKSVGIPDPEQRAIEYPHQLSGGMKQRVMIAIALAGKPELLIADEPTTALDVTIQAQVLALLKDLQRETGMAIMLITHDLGVVAEVADTVAVMYAGQIVETGSVAEFFQRPQHPYSIKLFSSLPSADKRAGSLDVIHGMVPALDGEFSACRFSDRCDWSRDICTRMIPEWRGSVGRGYLCHLEGTEINQASAKQGDLPPVGVGGNRVVAEHQDLLEIRDLRVHFPIQKGVLRRTVGYVKAVDGVDLSLAAGRTLALVGESGCGKTTVGKAVLQLIKPTAGYVTFEQIELTQLKGRALRKKRRDFQIIFQDPASSMNPRMLVGDIIAEGLVAQSIGGNKQARAVKVAELLDQVGLPASAANRYPHEFSGGQRQRICIARALALAPKLVVCDEPTSALDVSVQAQILNLLKGLQQDQGLAYLFITHNLSVVSYLAHEVAVMYLGRIVEHGTVEDVLSNPAHPYTKALLSAVPIPDPEIQREQIFLQGDLPSPSDPPPGCYFHPRCPMAMDSCRESYPQATQLSQSHSVACLLFEQKADA